MAARTVTTSLRGCCNPLRNRHLAAALHGSTSCMWRAAGAAPAGMSRLRLLTAPASAPRPSLRRGMHVCAFSPFAYGRQRQLNYNWGSRGGGGRLRVEVDALSEGAAPGGLKPRAVQQLLETLQEDAQAVVALALSARREREPRYRLPKLANLSLVLCDDNYIHAMNLVGGGPVGVHGGWVGRCAACCCCMQLWAPPQGPHLLPLSKHPACLPLPLPLAGQEHRGKNAPTDVLSFEMPDDPGMPIALPIKLLGDVVISLDTAARQAQERGCARSLACMRLGVYDACAWVG